MNHPEPLRFGMNTAAPDDNNPLTPALEMCEAIVARAEPMTPEQRTSALMNQFAIILTVQCLVDMSRAGAVSEKHFNETVGTIVGNAINAAANLGAKLDDVKRLCSRMLSDSYRSK